MSPFKVIRCRYYADDGKAIPPYCSAGRRCTFLHPGDKGWPGGDPAHEVSKRPDERDQSSEFPRLRAWKTSDRSESHSKANVSKSGGPAAATSMMDLVLEVSNPPTRRSSTHTSKDQPAVFSILQIFHDIAKFQSKITQGRESLHRTIDKVAAFKELAESLHKISPASAVAVNSTLDAIINTKHELELTLENDTKQLSDLWDDVFDIFLRAICRQIDNEVEAGTDFLREEARKLVKLFPKYSDSFQHSTLNAVDNPGLLRPLVMSGSNEGTDTRRNTCDTKGSSEELAVQEESVNPPIGLSDNGWGRKRRRVSPDGAEDNTEYEDVAPHRNLADTITRMQKQLDEQGDNIKSLIEQSQATQQANSLQSIVDHSSVKNNVQSLLSGPPHNMAPWVFEDLVSHIRRTLQSDILTFITPALENQKQVNEYWGMRLDALAEDLRKVTMINSRYNLKEDVVMERKENL